MKISHSIKEKCVSQHRITEARLGQSLVEGTNINHLSMVYGMLEACDAQSLQLILNELSLRTQNPSPPEQKHTRNPVDLSIVLLETT